MDDQVYYYHADMCKVFSHPKRLEAINILREGEMTVGELSQKLGLPAGNISQHLSMMKERRILTSRKAGNSVYYRIANPKLIPCFDMMQEMLFDQIRQDAAMISERRK